MHHLPLSRSSVAILAMCALVAGHCNIPVANAAGGDAWASGNGIVIQATERMGGAITSLQWKGKEFVDAADHGREIQTAWQFDGHGECYNPTEAGSILDNGGPVSTSKLLYSLGRGKGLFTVSNPAFWLPPGGDGFWCGFAKSHSPHTQWNGGKVINTTPVSRSLLQKNVQIGYADMDNVIEYVTDISFSTQELAAAPAHSIVLEHPAVYMPAEFSSAYRYDPEYDILVKTTAQRFATQPVILATTDKSYAMGILTDEIPQEGFSAHDQRNFLGYGYDDYSSTKKMSIRISKFPQNGVRFGAETVHTRSFLIVGSLSDVVTSMSRLHRILQTGKAPPPAPAGHPIGYHESATTGWACDGDDASRPLDIHFYADAPASAGGKFVGSAVADRVRSDVTGVCNGTTAHGFSFDPPSFLKDGKAHTIFAYAINIGQGAVNPLLTNSAQFFREQSGVVVRPPAQSSSSSSSSAASAWGTPAPKQPAPPLPIPVPVIPAASSSSSSKPTAFYNPIGFLDTSTWGWACDGDDVSRPLEIHFYADGQAGLGGTFIGSAMADIPRPDVASVCGGTVNHGFSFSIPDSLKDGRPHLIYAYAIDPAGGYNPLLSTAPRPFMEK